MKYFQITKKLKKKKSILLSVKNITKFKNLKISYLFYKTLVISIVCGKCDSKRKIIFKEKSQLR